MWDPVLFGCCITTRCGNMTMGAASENGVVIGLLMDNKTVDNVFDGRHSPGPLDAREQKYKNVFINECIVLCPLRPPFSVLLCFKHSCSGNACGQY